MEQGPFSSIQPAGDSSPQTPTTPCPSFKRERSHPEAHRHRPPPLPGTGMVLGSLAGEVRLLAYPDSRSTDSLLSAPFSVSPDPLFCSRGQ